MEGQVGLWSAEAPRPAPRPSIRGLSRTSERLRAIDWSETPMGPVGEWDPNFVCALNLLLESRFPMFCTWGEDHRLFYNDAFEPTILGKGVCLGQPITRVFAESWPDIGRLFQRALGGEAVYHEDLLVTLARNALLTPTWWSFSYSPLRAADGTIGGVFAALYETTRRFQAEQSLRSSEAALLDVTDMAPGLLWRCDPDGRLTWVNQALTTYLGAGRLKGHVWNDHVHPDDVALAVRGYQTEPYDYFEAQQRLRGANGEYRWFIVRAQLTRGAGGELMEWYGSASDIHDWRSAVDSLADRSQLLREFTGSEVTLMMVADVDTRRIEALNPEARIACVAPADRGPVRWDAWTAKAHPDDQAPLGAAFERAAGGETTQVKFRREVEDGLIRRFHATVFPMPAPDGAVRRVGAMVVDVTREVDARIYLIDPDAGRRNALAHGLTRSGVKVRSFSDVEAFERVAADLLPGCVVLGASSRAEATLKAAGGLSLGGFRLPWIVVGEFEGQTDQVVQLMKLGAADVKSGELTSEVVRNAAVAAMSIQKPGRADAPPADLSQKMRALSRREREVLEGLMAGGTNKSIAQNLGLSPRTVETHRAHLMDRLGVGTLAELLGLAAQAGLDVVKKS